MMHAANLQVTGVRRTRSVMPGLLFALAWTLFLVGMGALALLAEPVPGPQGSWTLGPWTRASEQPVIAPQTASSFVDPVSGQTVHWEALHTFNPAAVVRNGRVYVLYRAEDDSGAMVIGGHVSRLGLASSADGVHFERMPAPVL